MPSAGIVRAGARRSSAGRDGPAFWRALARALRDVTQGGRLEAAQARLLLDRAAYEAASQRGDRLRAVHEAALTMNAIMEAEPASIAFLVAEILRRAVLALNGLDGRIVLAEDAAWRDLTPESGPADGLILLDHRGRLTRAPVRPAGSTAHVLQTGELVHIAETLATGRFGPYPQLARHGVRSLVVVPLRISGRVIGTLAVTFGRPRELRAGDREVVELFAAHAAAALERARVLHAEQRRAQQQERLAATLARVGGAPDLVSALEALLRGAISLLGGADGAARLFGPHLGARPLELNLGADGRLISRINHPPLSPHSISARMQAGGPAELVDDFRALDAERFPTSETMRRRGMRSAVFVPIDGPGGRIGSLAVYHHLPAYFSPADLTLAEALATLAGAAIERARLDGERLAAVRAREAALDELARQTEQLARREAEAEALRELDALKDELLSTISHELRTPLTVVHGYAQHLLAGAHQFDAFAVERMASLMFANSRHLVRLVQDLVDFLRLGNGQTVVQAEPYDLVPQLEELSAAFRRQTGGERVTAELPPSLPVHADRARVEQIVSNLVDNALKYAPEGPIVLRARREGTVVRLEVQDAGPGIPPQEQVRVWEKLYRGSSIAGLNVVRGCGIGLAVVKALVEAQGGRVGVQSAPGQGACFWFELPPGPPHD